MSLFVRGMGARTIRAAGLRCSGLRAIALTRTCRVTARDIGADVHLPFRTALAVATADVAGDTGHAGVGAGSGITHRAGTGIGLSRHAVAVLAARLARITAHY